VEITPGGHRQTRPHHGLKSLDFLVADGSGLSSKTDDGLDAGRAEDLGAIRRGEPAENIPGEEGQLYDLNAI
jgi:hypothetical protein